MLLIVFIIANLCAYSQNNTSAKKILDDFSSKIKTHKCIEAKFTFSLENTELEISDSFDGEIILKGEKYKLLLMSAETYFDGKTMWSYIPDFEEVSISEPDKNDESIFDPGQIFNLYKEGFELIYNGEKDGSYQITMLPQESTEEYDKIDVLIIKKTLQLLSVKYHAKDGNMYIVKITDFTTDKNYEDKIFVFDTTKHSNIEVIDLR
ncbi:outer membrane lipoprotein carrier protein LolA [Bacteroidota bacterium]